MHIHISPSVQRWRFTRLKRIARAIIWFESALEVVYPPDRRGNWYTKANYADSSVLGDLNIMEALDYIEHCETRDDLIETMSPNNKYYAWNFRSLTKWGTIEFRRPPGVTNAMQAARWIDLVTTFLRSAQKVDVAMRLTELYPRRDVESLGRFLAKGTPSGSDQPGWRAGWNIAREETWRELLADKTGSMRVRKAVLEDVDMFE